MTVTPWTIYLITRLDAVSAMFVFFFVVALMAVGIAAIIWCVNIDLDRDAQEKAVKAAKACIIPLIVSAIGCATTPTTKQAVAMYIIPAVCNSRAVQKLPTQLEQLADEWVRELSPKRK